jgi:hypothetical protein
MAKGNMLKNYSSKIPMLVFLVCLAVFLGSIYLYLDAKSERAKESLTMRPNRKMTKDKMENIPKRTMNSIKRNLRNNYNKVKEQLVG